jgi:hypothetical protein
MITMKTYKNKYSRLTCLLVLIMLSAACKKDFSALNTNPNTSEFALPQTLLAPALTSLVSANNSRAQRITNELMQVTVNMGDGDGKIFRYEVRNSEADYLWNAWYTQLTNFKDIYKGGEDNANSSYMAVSLISQAWIYSMLTDTYGDVPFSNSNKGAEGNFTPSFDQQKDIYPALFAMLEEANTLLTASSATTNAIAATSDPIYAGDRAKWRKLGNSLYLRLLLRVSAKTELKAIDKIKEIVDTKAATYPVISSNEESAVLRWTGVAPYVSPFASWRDADWYTPKLSSFFVNNLNEWSDPRIVRWATVVEGEYAGIPSGYAPGQAPEGKSAFPTALQVEPLLGNIMNYAELQLILAEAAAKGWVTTKTAQNYYETGVNSGITFWGYAVPANYLTFAKVKWDDTYTLDQKMELIHLQKYYALFFTDMEQWFEYRRTGHPNLPKGAGLGNGGVMPARLNYPVYVQSANGENYRAAVAIQGVDQISTQVWWQKP